jgi:hypothetical protein
VVRWINEEEERDREGYLEEKKELEATGHASDLGDRSGQNAPAEKTIKVETCGKRSGAPDEFWPHSSDADDDGMKGRGNS